MYAEHVPKINAAMRESVTGFKRGLYFVIASIRQPVTLVPKQVEEIERYGTSAPCIFGHKVDAIAYIETHAAELFDVVTRENCPRAAILALTAIPGLGVVKAAFVCQMLGFDVACLDTRNIKREGRNPREFRSDGGKSKTGKAWLRKIDAYVSETEGRAEFYWNAWCNDVARVYKMTAEEISELHLSVFKPLEFTLEETFA